MVAVCCGRLTGALLAAAEGGGLATVRQLAGALAEHSMSELDGAQLTSDSMVSPPATACYCLLLPPTDGCHACYCRRCGRRPAAMHCGLAYLKLHAPK